MNKIKHTIRVIGVCSFLLFVTPLNVKADYAACPNGGTLSGGVCTSVGVQQCGHPFGKADTATFSICSYGRARVSGGWCYYMVPTYGNSWPGDYAECTRMPARATYDCASDGMSYGNTIPVCNVTKPACPNGGTLSGSTCVVTNGACNDSYNGKVLAGLPSPTSQLCSAGTFSGVSGNGPWSWSCIGSGGTTASCSATLFNAQAGQCGILTTLSPRDPVYSANAIWMCGAYPGSTGYCDFLYPWSGTVCKNNATAMSVTALYNLSHNVVNSWTCSGSNGASSVQCQRYPDCGFATDWITLYSSAPSGCVSTPSAPPDWGCITKDYAISNPRPFLCSIGDVGAVTYSNIDKQLHWTCNGSVSLSCASKNYVVNNTLKVSVDNGGRVTSNPAGIDCVNGTGACEAEFVKDSSVVLNESPSTGSSFAGWSDSCSGNAATCNVTIDAAIKSVKASFAPVCTPRNDKAVDTCIGQFADDFCGHQNIAGTKDCTIKTGKWREVAP